MKKASLILFVFSFAASSLAQSSSDGKIIFKNIGIATSQPNPALPGYIPGGNSNGTYNVPIYQGEVDAGRCLVASRAPCLPRTTQFHWQPVF
ncbi:MAG TPA: hypothetical protein VI282_00865 [Verrucomicrobiae bacterium]